MPVGADQTSLADDHAVADSHGRIEKEARAIQRRISPMVSRPYGLPIAVIDQACRAVTRCPMFIPNRR